MDNNRRAAVIAALLVIELIIVSAMVHSFDSVRFGAPAFAATTSQRTTKTLEAGAAPHVVIDDEFAALTISVKPGSAVFVDEQSVPRGFVRGTSAPLTVERTPDGVRIARSGDGLHVMFGSIERQLSVTVPPGARVDVRNAGKIAASGLRERAVFHSDNGRVLVRDHRGDLEVTTDNGRIELDDVRAATISLHTANGRIVANRTVVANGTVATNNGRIELGFDRGADLTVSAHTANGKVRALPPLTAIARDGADDDAPRTVTIGNGSGRLEVSSDNGSITIHDLGA